MYSLSNLELAYIGSPPPPVCVYVVCVWLCFFLIVKLEPQSCFNVFLSIVISLADHMILNILLKHSLKKPNQLSSTTSSLLKRMKSLSSSSLLPLSCFPSSLPPFLCDSQLPTAFLFQGPTATTVSWDSGRQTSSCFFSSILVSQDFPLVLLQPAHRSPFGQLTVIHLELAFLEQIQGPPSSSHLPITAFSAFSSPFLCDPHYHHHQPAEQLNQGLHSHHIWLGLWIGTINRRMGQPSDKEVSKYLHSETLQMP